MIIICLISKILIICFQCGEKMQGFHLEGKTFFKCYLTHERAMEDIEIGCKLQIKKSSWPKFIWIFGEMLKYGQIKRHK